MQLEKAARLVEQFEQGNLPKESWTHTAHFIMAAWYCVSVPLPQAVERIREGIRKYNVSIGGKNTDNSGYHETITLFYTTTIAHYLVTAGVTALTDESLSALIQQPFLEKNYIHQFYSRELLMSVGARRCWVEPDKMALGHNKRL
jgi:hypothetical protein